MIVLVNGAFGIGKTTVARALVARLPRAVLYDPELIGIALQRLLRLTGRTVGDFQDLRVWRKLTIAAIRVMRLFSANVVVPMAFSNEEYLQEIRRGLQRFEPHVLHFCLVAPIAVVEERLRRRGVPERHAQWLFRRASECCVAHRSGEFAMHVDAANRTAQEIANTIFDFTKIAR